MLIRPNGLYGAARTAYDLLGFRIAFTPFVFVAVFLGVLFDRMNNEVFFSVKTLITIAISAFTVLFKDVGTGIVSVAAFLVLAVFVLLGGKLPRIWFIYIGYLAVSISIIVFGIQNRIPLFSYLLEDVLGRDLTFDNRTYIWNSTMWAISNKPWLGYGINSSAPIVFPSSVKNLPAHNQLLCILADMGIVGFISFCSLFVITGSSISRYKSEKLRGIMLAGMIAMLIIFFTEIQSTKCLMFIVMIYAYKCRDLEADDSDVRFQFIF